MSPNSRKGSFDWRSLARTAAERAGYQPAPYQLEGDTFTRGGNVSPTVQIFFQNVTNSDIAPEAFLCVHVEQFEQDRRPQRGGVSRPSRQSARTCRMAAPQPRDRPEPPGSSATHGSNRTLRRGDHAGFGAPLALR